MKKRISVFAFDIGEISQMRRIEGFVRLGLDVTSYSMRRKNVDTASHPEWANVELCTVVHEQPLRRIIAIFISWMKLTNHLGNIAKSDTIIARNFDMLLIAIGVKILLKLSTRRHDIPLVYECLDIHSYFCAGGIRGKFARFVERLALKFVDRIVISSPAFENEYFKKIQLFKGEIALVENKIVRPKRQRSQKIRALGQPIKIGLVGTLRCAPSVELLLGLARLYPENFEVHFHGIVHSHSLPNFLSDMNDMPNVFFHGRYHYYNDLKEIYENLNFVWAQDLWQSNGNSMWLLPNRIYEASYFGCPSIALSTSETGHKIIEMGWGEIVDDTQVETLADRLTHFDQDLYKLMQETIHKTLRDELVQSDQELQAFLTLTGQIHNEYTNSNSAQ